MKKGNVKVMKYAIDSMEWKEILDRIEKESRIVIEKVGNDIYETEKDRNKWAYCMKH